MRIETFKARVQDGTPMAGTFLKTADVALVEVLAQSDLDFLCLDAEHSPLDRGALDGCLAIGRALDFPLVVRVGDGSAREILSALDMGAVGVVVPHVATVEKAKAVAKAAHFGNGGRGFAGSTRWAGFATRPMGDVLAQDAQTVVLAQIEEPEGVEAAQDIASVDGIDGLFVGPADLSVAYGHDSIDNPDLVAAMHKVGAATKATGTGFVSFTPTGDIGATWMKDYGISMMLVGSEQSWMRTMANMVAKALKG